MRNKHTINFKPECTCPKCGEEFVKPVAVDYVTNQRGDVIEARLK